MDPTTEYTVEMWNADVSKATAEIEKVKAEIAAYEALPICYYCRKPLNGKGRKGFCNGKHERTSNRLREFTGRLFNGDKPTGARF